MRDIQVSRNQESWERWGEYASQRERVTQLLLPPSATGALLVLGAGNCNDLDLLQLLPWYAEIHLVDLDSDALMRGVQRQGLSTSPNIVLHGGLEVTGVLDRCSAWSEYAPGEIEINDTIGEALAHTWSNLNRTYDVAASIGLLSQLLETVLHGLGANHSRTMDLLSAVRLRHMQLLIESLRPGGRAVLVTEIVSSASCPELTRTPPAELTNLLKQLINQRNFFTGLNPVVLESLWRQSPMLAPLVEQVELSRPWLWDFGPRVYACCALRGIRRNA